MPARRGRGARTNPAGRFESIHLSENPAELDEEELRQVETRYLADRTQSILAENDSPDIPFTYSINPYRGCEHGCVYCYARPSHEYLGFSAGLDFETRILIKEEAPRLLSEALQKPSWEPQVVSLSGNTDPYQPAERELRLTRRCLEVFLEHRNPVSVITKSGLITRDRDVLEELAERNLVRVMVSITSLRDEVAGAMEPRAARPALRFRAVEELAAAGVPTGVMVAPIVPGLTDEEVPQILAEAAARGAEVAGYTICRLPEPVDELFIDWLERHFPQRKEKVLNRLRDMRGGALSDSRFGRRMQGKGKWSSTIKQLFDLHCRKLHMNRPQPPLSTDSFRPLRGGQLGLFSD